MPDPARTAARRALCRGGHRRRRRRRAGVRRDRHRSSVLPRAAARWIPGRKAPAAPTCCPTVSSSADSSPPVIAIGGADWRGSRACTRRSSSARGSRGKRWNRVCRRCRRTSSRSFCSIRCRRSAACTRPTPRAADRMLNELIVYLRAALPHLQGDDIDAGKGVRARLRVRQHPEAAAPGSPVVRLRRRDRRPECAHAAHGAAASGRPGHSRWTGDDVPAMARCGSASTVVADKLRLALRQGVHGASATGATAIASIRERLQALYGDAAHLERAGRRQVGNDSGHGDSV